MTNASTHNTATPLTLTLKQATQAIKAVAHQRTVLVQGHMGTGKSSILSILAEQLPTHTPYYFDCTTKDLGDIMIPTVLTTPSTKHASDTTQFVRFATNEELGAHHHTPIILMLDELGKANPSVKNALLRLMLERKIGAYTLHPDSLIFATTNLATEGVGDLLPPHARNRITVITLQKPTYTEWQEWALTPEANIHPTLLAWVKDTPQLFESFETITEPSTNPYIYHPRDPSRQAFVTPRSLHAASDILHAVGLTSDQDTYEVRTSLLAGTIGNRAALDLNAYVELGDSMPTHKDCCDHPDTTPVPTEPSVLCMMTLRAIQHLLKNAYDPNQINGWNTYLKRTPKEVQSFFIALFVDQIKQPVHTNKLMRIVNDRNSAIVTLLSENDHFFN